MASARLVACRCIELGNRFLVSVESFFVPPVVRVVGQCLRDLRDPFGRPPIYILCVRASRWLALYLLPTSAVCVGGQCLRDLRDLPDGPLPRKK